MKNFFFVVLMIAGSVECFGQSQQIIVTNTSLGCPNFSLIFEAGDFSNDLCKNFISSYFTPITLPSTSFTITGLSWNYGVVPTTEVFHTVWVSDPADRFSREVKVSLCGPPIAILPVSCGSGTVTVEYQGYGGSTPDKLLIY